jgi:Leucine-rich repeat (LRR) protein
MFVLQETKSNRMPNLALWLLAPTLFSSVAGVVSSEQRCDMCKCSLAGSVLLLNCSDAKTRPGDNSGVIPQPYPDSYAHYKYNTTEAYFERNRIVNLGRLSLVDVNSLSLAQNEITVIDSGTFVKLTILKALSLKSNKLKTLYDKSFNGLSNLEILDLSQNMLTTIYPGTFTILNSLKALYLSHNMIEILKEKMFAISTLETLDVSFNDIAQIGSNVFENAANLTTLNLSNNNISVIEKYMFASLTSLQILDLSYNQIVAVNPSALSTLKSLKWLSLSWNKLETELQYLKIAADLQVLHLAGNVLKDLGEPLRSLKLRELHVQKNRLQNITVNGTRLRVRTRFM